MEIVFVLTIKDRSVQADFPMPTLADCIAAQRALDHKRTTKYRYEIKKMAMPLPETKVTNQ